MSSSDFPIVCVAGAPYSGTTMMELMLANTEPGFACGEVYALHRPDNPNNQTLECGCLDLDCSLWEQLKRTDEHQVYDELLDRFPDLHYLTDSSLYPWFSDQIDYHPNKSFHLVIPFKHPEIWLDSARSKDQPRTLEEYFWIYCRYIELSTDVRSVQFVNCHNFTDSPEQALQQITNELPIEHHQGMHRFWETKHHHLFGSLSARIHLAQRGSDAYKRTVQKLRETRDDPSNILENHRTIYSGSSPDDRSLADDHPAGQIYRWMNQRVDKKEPRAPWVQRLIQRVQSTHWDPDQTDLVIQAFTHLQNTVQSNDESDSTAVKQTIKAEHNQVTPRKWYREQAHRALVNNDFEQSLQYQQRVLANGQLDWMYLRDLVYILIIFRKKLMRWLC